MNKDQKMLDIAFLVLLDYAKEGKDLAKDLKAKKEWLETAPKGSSEALLDAMRVMERELGIK